jgi:hypothetical protein
MGWGLLNTKYKETMNTKIAEMSNDIEALKHHRQQCDEMHIMHQEHKKRNDDAMNNLTESNMMLAKSITDMNFTVIKVAGIVEGDRKLIGFLQNIGTAWSFNKSVVVTLGGLAAAIGAIIAVYNLL